MLNAAVRAPSCESRSGARIAHERTIAPAERARDRIKATD